MTAPAYAFTDPAPPEPERTRLLGGKGAGLVMMTQELGLPVPPGFTVPTSVCLDYLAHGWPTGLNGTLAEHLGRLEQAMGLRLGDPAAPLLVSVRSGAPISMPGMMDTVLNVGITPAVRDAIAAKDARFAADTWLRFSHMYASTVLGLDLGSAPKPETSIADLLAAADAVHRAAAAAGTPIPLDPQLQLRGAVEAVFRSWTSARAVAYRRHEGIPEDLGTAVTLQAMVFGNADERSGSGVVFTRDPATGANTPFGDYLPCAQGEDVVAGTHAVHGLHLLAKQLPAVDAELRAALRRLELHTRDMCDVEFTVDRGRLFILQTRVGKRSPIAAVTIAVDLTDDPEIRLTRAEAVARVAPDTLQKAAAAETVVAGATPVGRGLAASPGVGTGALCFDPDRAAELAAAGTPVALARQETSPEDVHGMLAASAILTTLGGVASHAAVVARGWGIPAITSLANARVAGGTLEIAGHVLREGDIVTVDGTDGALYLGDQRAEGAAADSAHLTELRAWAAEIEESATTASPPASAALDLYALARVVQLKGLCAKERAAANLGASPEAVEALTGDHPELFKAT
ncbi:MAG: pyruvate, phosphate dikinase, partial [Dehalococcoidia bacterium]